MAEKAKLEVVPTAVAVSVSRVKGNLKGGVDYAIGPKTLIIGDNGAGKSAVVNAIELALTGRASDIVGRAEVAKEVDLMALAPGRTGTLEVAVELSNGAQAVWSCSDAKGSKKAKHTLPPDVNTETVLPLRAVRDAILGSAQTARNFFLRHAVGALTMQDVLARIPEPLHARLKSLNVFTAHGDTVTDLLRALDEAKKRQRDSAARTKAAEQLTDTNAAGLPPEPTEEALKEVEAQIEVARQTLTSIALQATVTHTKTQYEAKVAEYQTLVKEKVQLEALLQAVPSPGVETTQGPEWSWMGSLLEWMIGQRLRDCVLCGSQDVGVQFPARLEKLRAHFRGHAAVGDATQARQRLLVVINAIETARTVGAELERQLNSAASVPTGASAETARGTLDAATATRDGLIQAKAQWDAVRKTRDAGIGAEVAVAEWKQLVKALNGVIGTLLDGAVEQFTERVQRYLPEGLTFGLTLRDGDREVLQFGLVEGDALHTALSGAEWVQVLTAIGSAVSEGATGPTVLIPEERAFHPRTLERVMEAWAQAPVQVILTHPTAPARIPQGWTVIDVDATP